MSEVAISVAAVTMVYNEPDFLPLWIKYYSGQVGEDRCYVIDHGSSDGSTEHLGVNVLRIPRSPMHDEKRARFISDFASSLLEWHDAVIYSDVDEFLIADPTDYASLPDFCSRSPYSITNAIGVNLLQTSDEISPLDTSLPVLRQRGWTRFIYSMCKPLVTKSRTKWVPGFHSSNHPMAYDKLFLFHLHYCDLAISLRRLAKTRNMPWGDGAQDHYQRWTDEKHEQMSRSLPLLPKADESAFDADGPIFRGYTDWALKFATENPEKRDLFYFQDKVPINEIIRVPERFRGIL